MLRRTLFVGLSAMAILGLTACSGPITKSETIAPGSAFTPKAAKALLGSVNTIEDVILIYGEPQRAMKGKNQHQNMKGFVWEWVATRPSFIKEKDKRDWFTPTVKKELHVWRDRQGKLADAEVTGVFYVQTKLPGLMMTIQEMRAMTKDELESDRVPIFSMENFKEVNAYYKTH